MAPNLYLLVADGKVSEVNSILSQNPSLASSQDAHGYSLVHAAASYNQFDLLRKLITDYHVDVNIRDEDNETPLFSVETLEVAKLLVEELGADVLARGASGRTAGQAIEEDGDFPDVAQYLRGIERQLEEIGSRDPKDNAAAAAAAAAGEASPAPLRAAAAPAGSESLPPVPDGLQVRVGTMSEADASVGEVDPEFRARILQLASRDDLNTPEGQAQLRQLVQDAVAQQNFGEDRHVRPKTNAP